ncbi:MAG: hypothetical protein ACFBZ9_11960 [Sphingomonadales bacterium]
MVSKHSLALVAVQNIEMLPCPRRYQGRQSVSIKTVVDWALGVECAYLFHPDRDLGAGSGFQDPLLRIQALGTVIDKTHFTGWRGTDDPVAEAIFHTVTQMEGETAALLVTVAISLREPKDISIPKAQARPAEYEQIRVGNRYEPSPIDRPPDDFAQGRYCPVIWVGETNPDGMRRQKQAEWARGLIWLAAALNTGIAGAQMPFHLTVPKRLLSDAAQ